MGNILILVLAILAIAAIFFICAAVLKRAGIVLWRDIWKVFGFLILISGVSLFAGYRLGEATRKSETEIASADRRTQTDREVEEVRTEVTEATLTTNTTKIPEEEIDTESLARETTTTEAEAETTTTEPEQTEEQQVTTTQAKQTEQQTTTTTEPEQTEEQQAEAAVVAAREAILMARYALREVTHIAEIHAEAEAEAEAANIAYFRGEEIRNKISSAETATETLALANEVIATAAEAIAALEKACRNPPKASMVLSACRGAHQTLEEYLEQHQQKLGQWQQELRFDFSEPEKTEAELAHEAAREALEVAYIISANALILATNIAETDGVAKAEAAAANIAYYRGEEIRNKISSAETAAEVEALVTEVEALATEVIAATEEACRLERSVGTNFAGSCNLEELIAEACQRMMAKVSSLSRMSSLCSDSN